MVAIGIKEEASAEIEALAARCHWISLGALTKLIEICHGEGITQVMMCGQVKHAKIFSSIVPDLRLVKLLASIETKNTEGLIGGVTKVLKDEGIELVDSTLLLKDLLAPAGVLTRRKLTAEEERDIEYGRRIAAALSGMTSGRVWRSRSGLAWRSRRWRERTRCCGGRRGWWRESPAVGKGSRRRKHMLYDVPVVGPQTIEVMRETGATALAIDAGRTLLMDREEVLRQADAGRSRSWRTKIRDSDRCLLFKSSSRNDGQALA